MGMFHAFGFGLIAGIILTGSVWKSYHDREIEHYKAMTSDTLEIIDEYESIVEINCVLIAVPEDK
jgi:hypothetical protein